MRVTRIAAVGMSIGVMLGFGVLSAPAATADSVWFQAYERASEDSPCVSPADETPWQDSFEGQQAWTPSWAEWANGGKGGWVCQRQIVWAKDSAGPGCVVVQDNWLFIPGYDPHYYYLQFGGGVVLPAGTPGFRDAGCTDLSSELTSYAAVYASSESAAQGLCDAAVAETRVVNGTVYGGDPNVWLCPPLG